MTIVKQVIEDSSRNIVVKYFITGAGDLIGTVLFDASEFTDATGVSLKKIIYNFTGFSAYLEWVGTVNGKLLALSADNAETLDFWDHGVLGGIPNNATGVAKNGDIVITTSGLAGTDNGFIWLFLTK